MKSSIKTIILILSYLIAINKNSIAQSLDGTFDSKFVRYQYGQPFSGVKTLQWNDIAWKGDRLYKQIILWNNGNTALSNITYEINNLTQGANSIPSTNIKLRFENYAKSDPEARSCSEYSTRTNQPLIQIADALSNTQITSVSKQDPLKIWVTVDIPQSTIAGIYAGSIIVKVNGIAQKTFNISLNVVDKTLPAVNQWSFHLDIWQYPYQILKYYNDSHPAAPIIAWSPQHFQMIKPSYKLLADMGQKAITAHIKDDALGGPSMIKWVLKTDGTWTYDYTAFTNYINFFNNEIGISSQINCFSLIGWNEDEIPYWDEATNSKKILPAPVGSTIFNARWNDFLTKFNVYLTNNGWFNKTVLFMDEITDAKMQQVITIIKNNNPNWKIGVAHVKELSQTVTNKLYDKAGSLALASGKTNNVSSFYTSCSESIPNNYLTPQNNPAEMSWMPWHSIKENLDGYLRWGYDFWNNSDPFELRNGGNTAGDFAMIYRSSNELNAEIMSSIRLELLRDGIQDFEKIKILRNQLSISTNLFDQETLTKLNAKINQFTKNSGIGANILVQQGQQLLKDISTGSDGVCKVGGGSYSNYYLTNLATTGGLTNINFSGGTFPNQGVSHFTSSKVSVIAGSTFSLTFTTSSASNCARVKAWIDWNNDNDFLDSGEEVFSGGAFQSCSNPLNYSTNISVPNGISIGEKRLRIQLRDAWNDLPNPCGINNFTSTSDFDIVINDTYCSAKSNYNTGEYFLTKLQSENACNGNIQYSQTVNPTEGYSLYQDNSLKANVGSCFTLKMQNSATASCARTKVWIDWNKDGDFNDIGEEIFTSGDFQTCINPIQFKFNVLVPLTAKVGVTRMRVQIRDSWQDVPNPCYTDIVGNTTDFNVEIGNNFASCIPSFISPVGNSQLQGTTSTFYWANNGLSNVNYWKIKTSYQQNGLIVSTEKQVDGSVYSLQLTDLPSKGQPIKVTLGWQSGNSPYQEIEYDYQAYDTYCKVGGGSYKGYFIQNLSTSGATNNINIERTSYPEGGYELLSPSMIHTRPGETFNIHIKTSLASYSALIKVWIDWNGDGKFYDYDLVFSGGVSQSNHNPNDYSFPVAVPYGYSGIKRMRIQVYDAWATPSPYACGVINATSTLDVNIMYNDFYFDNPCYIKSSLRKLTGKVIGSIGSSDGFSTREKAFDNDTQTYFDAPSPNGNWVGLDLGKEMIINTLSFVPRSGYEQRSNWGKFQISNDSIFSNPVTLSYWNYPLNWFEACIVDNIADGGVKARYVRYLSADNSWGNIAEMRVFGLQDTLKIPSTTNAKIGVYPMEQNTDSHNDKLPNEDITQPLLFPNPSSSILTIKNVDDDEIKQIRVFSMQGIEVFPKVVENNKLDISNLPAGVYMIKFNTWPTQRFTKY